jgi:hypothetical protein
MKIGVEIAVTGIVIDNIPINLEYYDELLVLCIDDKIRKKIDKQIKDFSEDIQAKVKVQLLKEYFISL